MQTNGERLDDAIARSGISKHRLAEESGISYRTICRLVNDESAGNLWTWQRLADALGCSVGELVD